MVDALIKLLLPLGMWLLTKFFEKIASDTEAKKKFLEFIEAMERDQLASVKLNDDDRAQLDDLKRRRALLLEQIAKEKRDSGQSN